VQRIEIKYKRQKIALFTHDDPDHLANAYRGSKTFYELDLLKKAAKIYQRGTTIVDVGANIGNHTVYFAKILGAPVLAFEPFAKNREILRRNIEENGCASLVEIERLAIGSVRGRASTKFFDPANLAIVKISPDVAGELEMTTLDEFLPRYVRIGLIKIDVEGGDLEVLKGAERTLTVHKPSLFVEAATDPEFQAVKNFLEKFGYRPSGRYCWTPTYLFRA
jgi:FkbM family methyltransferase